MNGLRLGVSSRQIKGNLRELNPRSIWRGIGEVAACLWLYGTENIGLSAPLVLVVLSGFAARCGRRGGADAGMQRDRLFIQTYHWLSRIIWFLIRLQNVFHFGDVIFIEFRHAPHFFPATA